MITTRKLTQMARKWLRAAAAGRKKIAFRRGEDAAAKLVHPDVKNCTAAAPAKKGCFVVYSCDGHRFEVPLACLKSQVFEELLRMSEEHFGLQGTAPIILPCDAAFVQRAVSCLRRRPSKDTESALLASMAAFSCSAMLALPPSCSLLFVHQQPQVVC